MITLPDLSIDIKYEKQNKTKKIKRRQRGVGGERCGVRKIVIDDDCYNVFSLYQIPQ